MSAENRHDLELTQGLHPQLLNVGVGLFFATGPSRVREGSLAAPWPPPTVSCDNQNVPRRDCVYLRGAGQIALSACKRRWSGSEDTREEGLLLGVGEQPSVRGLAGSRSREHAAVGSEWVGVELGLDSWVLGVTGLWAQWGGDFPGGPAVRTLPFHCGERGFHPWSEN